MARNLGRRRYLVVCDITSGQAAPDKAGKNCVVGSNTGGSKMSFVWEAATCPLVVVLRSVGSISVGSMLETQYHVPRTEFSILILNSLGQLPSATDRLDCLFLF